MVYDLYYKLDACPGHHIACACMQPGGGKEGELDGRAERFLFTKPNANEKEIDLIFYNVGFNKLEKKITKFRSN